MSYETTVAFGDCDPAGIVWYPRLLGWMDHAFHAALRRHGGHGALCERLVARGVGVVELGVTFRSPVIDGDVLTVLLRHDGWSQKSFRLCYEGRVGARLAFEGFERRAVFVDTEDGRMRAGPTEPLRRIMDA